MNRALDQARLDWVTKHLELAHAIYEAAARGDIVAQAYRNHIWERAHLTERQITDARAHIMKITGNEAANA